MPYSRASISAVFRESKRLVWAVEAMPCLEQAQLDVVALDAEHQSKRERTVIGSSMRIGFASFGRRFLGDDG